MPDEKHPTAEGATAEDLETSERLIDFIHRCPSMFHTATTISTRLDQAGFTYLPESDAWDVEPGGSYYTTRNGSSVIAFSVGEDALDRDTYHFQMTAAHADSPTYKVKSVPVLEGPEKYLRLNVEGYGGMIDYTWLDKPLSLAGRVLVRTATGIESRLFAPDRDLLLIPSVAIHLNRSVNDGKAFNKAVDLCPLFSAGRLHEEDFDRMVAEGVGASPEDVLARDLPPRRPRAPAPRHQAPRRGGVHRGGNRGRACLSASRLRAHRGQGHRHYARPHSGDDYHRADADHAGEDRDREARGDDPAREARRAQLHPDHGHELQL